MYTSCAGALYFFPTMSDKSTRAAPDCTPSRLIDAVRSRLVPRVWGGYKTLVWRACTHVYCHEIIPCLRSDIVF